MGRGRKSWSLCWDCRNAVDPLACEWVDNGTPVNGWWATPTQIRGVRKTGPIASYHVTLCPKFVRGSYNGGLEDNVFSGNGDRIELDRNDIKNVAEAICEKAIEDWKSLDYGNLSSLQVSGETITRAELLDFFFSEWFERLIHAFSRHSPEQIRHYIKIEPSMKPKEGETTGRKYR